jgi:ADP-ribose pyrophosphatase YjhB (NUDIX family)
MADARLFAWAQRLQAIAQSGLAYDPSEYDRERYERIAAVAREIFAAATGTPAEAVSRWFAPEVGYATPKLDVRAAAFRGDELLLVREASSDRWTLPGGWAEVGSSAGESAAREGREESGFAMTPIKLIALHDRERQGYRPHPWYTHKATFLCALGSKEAAPDHEVVGVGFFGERELPPLDEDRTSPTLAATCFAHRRDPALQTEFD